MSLAGTEPHPTGNALWRWLRFSLAWLGRATRRRLHFVLTLASLSGGVVLEAGRWRAWRRPVRAEFWRSLRVALAGGLIATIFVAALIGIGMVFQALYWLRIAGQEDIAGTILVTVLLREVTPLLIGIILLGRSGTVILSELGNLQISGQGRAIGALGVDPFLLLVMPRGIASALAAYTLGIVFLLVALVVGFVAASLLGALSGSLWTFLDSILRATVPIDFIIFPVKMLAIGLTVATTAALTALTVHEGDSIGRLIARGFMRGMLVIMVMSGLLSLAA
jgi:phospholipid/cholesterol/gamma-HCH transport system permease protein